MTPADLARALVAAPWWEWRAPLVCIDADGMRWLVYEGSGGLICGQGVGHAGHVGGWALSVPILLPGLRMAWETVWKVPHDIAVEPAPVRA